MVILALVLSLAALTASILAVAVSCVALTLGRLPTRRQAAGAPAAAEDDKGRDEEERSRAMDEGFENIMSFSVGGRNGFGQEGFRK